MEDLFGTMPGGGTPGGARRGAASGGAAAPRGGTTADLEVALEDVAAGTTARVQIGDKRMEVKVPAGIETGQKIRLAGKAPDGGDLTLTIKVQPHPVFTRTGADVSRELPITLGEALLGGEIPVGTLSGRTLLLTVPPGTQNGRQFRLRGHGLPRFKADGAGDLLVRLRVVMPGPLDDAGTSLAKALVDHVNQPSPRDGHREPARPA